MGVLGQSPLPEKSRTIWRRHNGDCAFWSGQVSGFVPILRTHHTMGVLGSDVVPCQYTRRLVVHQTMSDRQSPLPVKEPHHLEAVR